MSFSDAVENMIETVFDTFSETVTLNGEPVSADFGDIEQVEDGRSVVDVLSIEFQAADYPTITYRSDTVLVNGETWQYPKLVSYDAYTKTVQFRRDVRVSPR